jgi:NADH dehydrogenase FAD-containing subunit
MATVIPRPTIAIVGGGVGGTVLANLLAPALDEDEARIVLIDQSGHHIYQPGWLYHVEKALFSKAYWYLVPPARV